MDGQEGEDESKDQDVAATGRSGKHAVTSVMPKLRTEKIAKVNKTFHRSHTSPGLEANSSGRKKLDWEDRDKVRDMLIGSGKSSNSGKRADGATKSMVITKDENDSLKLSRKFQKKEAVKYISVDELVFNSKPGHFGQKSKSATWKSVNVVVKYVEEACLDRCREIYRLLNLDDSRHQNILPYVGICSHPASIIVSYVDSGSLRDHLYQTNRKSQLFELKEIEWSSAVAWMSQAAAGIKFLHDKSIVHGSVATHSFMMQSMNDGKYCLKVSDMGLHQPVQDVELAGRKLHWDAPELVVKDGSGKKFSKQTDAYGFGMCLYEMLHRRQPWKNVKNVDVKKKLQNGERPSIRTLLSGDDPAVDNVLAVMKSCWKNESEDRCTFETIQRVLNYAVEQCRESEINAILPLPRNVDNHSSSSEDEQNGASNVATNEKDTGATTPTKHDTQQAHASAISPLQTVEVRTRSAFDLLAPPENESSDDDGNVDDDVVNESVNSPKVKSDSEEDKSLASEGNLSEDFDVGVTAAYSSAMDLLSPPPDEEDDE